MKRVFEPFFTTKPEGIGLGLSIAHTIIERAGGAISAENRPTGGAVFRFSLPAASARPVKSDTGRHVPGAAGRRPDAAAVGARRRLVGTRKGPVYCPLRHCT